MGLYDTGDSRAGYGLGGKYSRFGSPCHGLGFFYSSQR